MRVVIFEPSAVDFDRTHNLKALIGHTTVFLENKISVVWVPNQNCRHTLTDVASYPLFTYTIYDDARKNNISFKSRFNCFRNLGLSKSVGAIILEILNNLYIGSDDHIFIPTTDWILFKAIMDKWETNPIRRMPTLHFLLMYEEGAWMTGGYPYRKIINILKKSNLFRTKIHVYCETQRHASSLSQILDYEIPSYPFPSIPLPRTSGNPGPPKKIRVGALGGGRRDKGFGKLPEIIEEFKKYRKSADVEFLIQKPRLQDRLDAELAELLNIENVTVLSNQLPQQLYNEYLVACDLMLFPYNRVVYFSRGSGIVNEALANGIPIVCTSGASLEECLTHQNGLSASNSNEFASALLSIVDNLPMYQENAKKAAHSYNNALYNNPVVRNLKRDN